MGEKWKWLFMELTVFTASKDTTTLVVSCIPITGSWWWIMCVLAEYWDDTGHTTGHRQTFLTNTQCSGWTITLLAFGMPVLTKGYLRCWQQVFFSQWSTTHHNSLPNHVITPCSICQNIPAKCEVWSSHCALRSEARRTWFTSHSNRSLQFLSNMGRPL